MITKIGRIVYTLEYFLKIYHPFTNALQEGLRSIAIYPEETKENCQNLD